MNMQTKCQGCGQWIGVSSRTSHEKCNHQKADNDANRAVSYRHTDIHFWERYDENNAICRRCGSICSVSDSQYKRRGCMKAFLAQFEDKP